MKILVLSDSHHCLGYMLDAVEREKPDAIIHLGDFVSDAEELGCVYPQIPICSVPGNCDYTLRPASELVTEYASVRFFITHGHRYGVKSGTDGLFSAASRAGASVALFGHTHRPFLTRRDGVLLMNPGSCGYAAGGSYGVLELCGGEVSGKLLHTEQE